MLTGTTAVDLIIGENEGDPKFYEDGRCFKKIGCGDRGGCQDTRIRAKCLCYTGVGHPSRKVQADSSCMCHPALLTLFMKS
jgi:hypothetical protein